MKVRNVKRGSGIEFTSAGLFDFLVNSIDSRLGTNDNFSCYQNDPVAFCSDILGETLTPDVIEMLESVRDNMITVAISANATGKTHGAARTAIWFYKVFQECKVVTAAAPPFNNLKKLLWGEIDSVVYLNPELFKDDTITSMEIKRGPKQTLIGVSIPATGTDKEREAQFSGKHQEHMLFIFDEGDAVPDPPYKGAESCMSGGHFRMLIMFNPRQASGAVYRMIRDNQANVVHLSAFNHPNVLTGDDIIPGAVDRQTTVRRINEWTRPKIKGEKIEKESLFVLPDFLVGAVAKRKGSGFYPPLQAGEYVIVNSAFSYMVLGRYPAQGVDQLISRDWVSRARSRYDVYVAQYGKIPPVGVPGIVGVDCAEMGDDYNAICARYGGYMTDFTPGTDTWNGIDTIETGSKATDWYNSHQNISSAYVDGTGVGAGVAPHMYRLGCSAISVKAAASPTYKTELGEFGILRDQLWWQVREWLRTDSSAMIPPDEELIEELTTPTYEIQNGKIKVMSQDDIKEVLGRSPNKADALRHTFAGVTGGFFDNCQFDVHPSMQGIVQ